MLARLPTKICIIETARGPYPDEPGNGGVAHGAAPAGARQGLAAVGAEGGVPARRQVELRRGTATLARRLQDQVGGREARRGGARPAYAAAHGVLGT